MATVPGVLLRYKKADDDIRAKISHQFWHRTNTT